MFSKVVSQITSGKQNSCEMDGHFENLLHCWNNYSKCFLSAFSDINYFWGVCFFFRMRLVWGSSCLMTAVESAQWAWGIQAKWFLASWNHSHFTTTEFVGHSALLCKFPVLHKVVKKAIAVCSSAQTHLGQLPAVTNCTFLVLLLLLLLFYYYFFFTTCVRKNQYICYWYHAYLSGVLMTTKRSHKLASSGWKMKECCVQLRVWVLPTAARS